MEEKPQKKFLPSILLFVVIFGITAYILARGLQFDVLYRELSHINGIYLCIAVICALLFTLLESANIRRILNSLGYKISMGTGIKYGATGFFFSGLTPSATGGQPMQLYYMHRDGIKFSHGSMTLLIEFASLQVISTGLGFAGFIINYHRILSAGSGFGVLLILGLIVNMVILLLLIGLIFLPKTMNALVNRISVFLLKFKFFRKHINHVKIDDFLSEYHTSVSYLKQNPSIFAKTVATTFVQMLAFYSVIYFVCLALGITHIFWWDVSSLQAVFSVGLSFIPLPGVVGVTEYGFLVVFQSVFSEELLSTVLILTRTISFYFLLVVSGIYVGLSVMSSYVRKRRTVHVRNVDQKTE